MTNKKYIQNIAKSIDGDNQVFHNSVPTKIGNDEYFEPLFKSLPAATNYTMLLRALPEIIQDHLVLSEAVNKLIEIVIQQQIEISENSYKLEELVRANIALKAQENVHGIIEKLTAQGSDVNKPEIVIKLSARFTQESSETLEKSSKKGNDKSLSRSGIIAGNLQALSQVLAGIKVGGSMDSKNIQALVDEYKQQTYSLNDVSYQGDVTIKFESITGSPMAKAQAEALRVGKQKNN